MKTVLRYLFIFWLIAVGLSVLFVTFDKPAQPESPGEIVGTEPRTPFKQALTAGQKRETGADKQILFGDLHVHSTFSTDAFAWALPMLGGDGVRPIADACDYARYCSALDFWSINDHAESLTPAMWQQTRESIRDCNSRAGSPLSPDTVAFLGWEWTPSRFDPNRHYGHKNVLLLDTDDSNTPARPIAAHGYTSKAMREQKQPWWQTTLAPYWDFPNRQIYKDLALKQKTLRDMPLCPSDRPSPELPTDCLEFTETPDELFKKLSEWGFPTLVIPHGNAWGHTTPPGIGWHKQLQGDMYNPEQQNMIEIFSGHGNSEEYRPWRHVEYRADGSKACPADIPNDGFEPCCQRAASLIQARCDDPDSALCQQRMEKARQDYIDAGRFGHLTVPGASVNDWGSCGQCEDCYLPAFALRPGGSTQAALAVRNFDELDDQGRPRGNRFGIIASSDNHNAQPGTGYKEMGRHLNTDAHGARDKNVQRSYIDKAKRSGKEAESQSFDPVTTPYNSLQVSETERLGSFFYTGGLVALHADGRDRQSIWKALQRREVYGTSGPRMLLWFDLLNSAPSPQPMGSEVQQTTNPRFRVRAIGAHKQLPGCPADAVAALGEQRLQHLCGGECLNPSNERQPITAIEVVRIRPQANPDEALADLIEDPWRRFSCSGDEAGCQVEFEDPDYAAAGREFVYYVRALQAATPTVNGDGLRCQQRDEQGRCLDVEPCYPDYRTGREDDCLANQPERAWSSPIFLSP